MPFTAAAPRPLPERRGPRGPGTLAHAAAPVGAARERARKRVVQLVFLIYLLAILEGALRKWVAPQLGAYLFFLRDPVLLAAYFIATRHALWPRRSPFFTASLWMAALGVTLFALQAMTGGPSEQRLLLGVYGWRSYFLYLPLAFLVGAQFNRHDLLRLYKLTLWLAVPIALLVAAQFFSPPGAAINVGTSEDELLQFRGLTQTYERTRPMGPFASGAGQNQFVAVAAALLIAFFVAPRQVPQPAFGTLLVTGAGVLTCIAMSGSRGAALQCGVSLLAAMTLGAVGRGGALKGRAFIWPLVIGVGALLAYPLVFPDGYAAFMQRWTQADKAESRTFENTGIFGRALYGLVDFGGLIELVPLLGYGLGFGGNASITLGASIDGVKPGFLAETDFSRHMVDLGPLFGVGYIAFRLALVAWLGAKALRATRQTADPVPMLLLSYAGMVILSGQITGQGTVNFFAWLFAGALIAACNQTPVQRPAPALARAGRAPALKRAARSPPPNQHLEPS